jgi:hypothetical protein
LDETMIPRRTHHMPHPTKIKKSSSQFWEDEGMHQDADDDLLDVQHRNLCPSPSSRIVRSASPRRLYNGGRISHHSQVRCLHQRQAHPYKRNRIMAASKAGKTTANKNNLNVVDEATNLLQSQLQKWPW